MPFVTYKDNVRRFLRRRLLDGLQLTPDLRVPRPHLIHTDVNLADRLRRAWWLRYGQKRDKQKTAKVFRSLEAAYDALGLRFSSHSSLSAVGLSTVPWTTAIEVLAPPARGSEKKWHCARLIGRHEFSDPRLRRKMCWVKEKGARRHMTLAQRVYLRLHEARSKFVHGDKVSVKLLLTDGDDAPPLLSLASTIYRTALMAQRSTTGLNPGRRSRKSNQDCTICFSCRCTGPCWTVPRKRENQTGMAGLRPAQSSSPRVSENRPLGPYFVAGSHVVLRQVKQR